MVAYDQVAPIYDSLYREDRRAVAEDFVVRRDLTSLMLGRDVLDVACGTGYALDLVPDFGWPDQYVGTDLSAEMIAAASSKHPKAHFTVEDQFKPAPRFHVADVALSLWALNYASDKAEAGIAINALWAALRPGGRLYAIMGSPRRPHRVDYGVDTSGSSHWSAKETAKLFWQFRSVGIRGLGRLIDAAPRLPQPALNALAYTESHTLGLVAPDLFHFFVITGRK